MPSGRTPTGQFNSTVTLLLDADRSVILPVNPEDIRIDRPSRQTVTQTLTGAYQDHLGEGLITVQMRGHTGWRGLRSQFADGYAAYIYIRDMLREYDDRVAKGDPSKIVMRLLLDIPTGWEHFRVSKNGVVYSRSRSQPLLFRYEMDFTVLSDELHPNPPDPSPAFVITVKSTPPPPPRPDPFNASLVLNDGSDASGGGGGKGLAKIKTVVNKKLLFLDDTFAQVTSSAFVAKTLAQPQQYQPGSSEYLSYDTSSLDALGIKTIGDLASTVYGQVQGWKINPGALWVIVAHDNPQWFVNADYNTSVPVFNIDSSSSTDTPPILRIRKLDPAPYNYNAMLYLANYSGPELVPTRTLPVVVNTDTPVGNATVNVYRQEAQSVKDVEDVLGDLWGGISAWVGNAIAVPPSGNPPPVDELDNLALP